MSTKATSKTPLLLSLLALIVGGAIGYGVGVKVEQNSSAPNLQACQQHIKAQADQLEHSAEQYQALVSDSEDQSKQLEQATTELTAMTKLVEKQKADFAQQLASLAQKKQQLSVSQKKLEVTKKKLDTEVVKLKTTTNKQQVVIDKSQQYFERQAEMQANVKSTQAKIVELQQTAKGFKKACDEFKSGNSWNWVSQKDCDNYDQQLGLLKNKQAILATQQQALAVINDEIGKK
ncbi:chromosome segregation ATPase [Photobacterium kishitanii]|uniref:chromosome segregation ATPase n=1 Tax=Photobacterium kishitanii TaxID=318456 RepID=UPI000D16F203|nr:chromosome segregation ATPase [Photobacterium kishitanii]PSW58830.1 chromosome segregation ATPase [Photobacterium kishitanii]